MQQAIQQARKSAGEGGVPVGACLVHNEVVVALGHNHRQQEQSVILHGEMDCLRKAGLFGRWSACTLYTSLSPCMMCSGAIVQFRIPRVVIGDATNFGGNEPFLRDRGVQVDVQEDSSLISFFKKWKNDNLEIWNGDIGV